MRIAAAAYPLDWFDAWADYEAKLSRWVAEAAGQGADLLAFPEYGAMELASLAGPAIAGDQEAALCAVAERIGAADDLHAGLARQYGVHILAASGPVYDPGPRPVNRARLFAPDGSRAHQDKQVMTRYERDSLDVRPGGRLKLFDTALGRIGILICYDVEFPLLARVLVEAGAEIILAPSCTEQLSGYWRVRVGAMARALEGQCVVVHAPTVGPVSWNPTVDTNTGAAAIYGPPDLGFPDTGVLAEGALNAPGWVYADIAPGAVAAVRRDGRVANVAHWPEQVPRTQTVECVALGASELEKT